MHLAGPVPPLFGEEIMLTPAQKHFQTVMAERHGKTDEQSDTARTAHEQIMHRLRMDQSALKRVQSDQAKAAMKRQLLLMRSAINEGQKARYLESKNVSIYESELQKKHPF